MKNTVFKDVVSIRNQILWILLGFQSGFMNAGGFLACHRFVSHMTGYGSYVGVALGQKEYLNAFEMGLAPFFFLAGAIFAGWLVDRRLILEQQPRVMLGLTILALINLGIFLGEVLGYFGSFGEPLVLQRDFALLFCLCFACGLQNGLFVGLTDGKVRTTHMTGPITDIGINFSKIMTLDRNSSERSALLSMNWLRVKIVVAFSMGSMIAAIVFLQVTFEGFAVPMVISMFLVAYLRLLFIVHRRQNPVEGEKAIRVPVAAAAGVGRD